MGTDLMGTLSRHHMRNKLMMERRQQRVRKERVRLERMPEETAADWAELLLSIKPSQRQSRFADVPRHLKRETAILYLDSMRRAA